MKKVISSLSAAGLLAFTGLWISNASAEDKPHHHEGHKAHMLEGYLAVADSLYKDDLEAAKNAAEEMVNHDEKSMLAEPASEVADAKTIEEARKAFKQLSAKAVEMAKMDEGSELTVMKCPMVKGGGGIWLSADKKVNNPYFGAMMPHCGGPMK